jgi:hypothetical protein
MNVFHNIILVRMDELPSYSPVDKDPEGDNAKHEV